MSKKLFSKVFILLLVVGLLFAAAPIMQAQAADISFTCTGAADSTALQTAIDGAADGDKILVSGTCVLDSNVTINKAVTLDGGGTAEIKVSGAGYRITMSAAGATLQGFDIEKTDKTDAQNIIYIGASNVTIATNKIHGQWAIGDIEVSRAMENPGGLTGLVISGNEIWALRQPAYINGTTTGVVSNNYVHGTKGWVLQGGNLTFTGNTFSGNVGDIAILGGPTGVPAEFYTDIVAMSAANNGAVIEDQRMTPALMSVVYVDAAAAAGGNGTQATPLQTIQAGINRVAPGGTVHVAAGDYNIPSTMTLAKAVTVSGPTTGEAKLIKADGNTTNNIFLITTSDVTIQNLTLTLNGAPTMGDAFIQANEVAKANIQILNNEIYVGPQSGPMTGWKAQGIYLGKFTTNSKINSNTIYNTRGGAIAHYNCEVEYRDNVIYNTKGGIMNYASDAANALKRVMVNNSWGTVHNEWDIVWNSGAGVWDFDQIDLVLDMSKENNDAYVVTQLDVDPILSNRSHVFVNAVTGTETLNTANGNMNLPYKKIQDAIDAVVPGGTIFVAAGTYEEAGQIVIDKNLTIVGADKATTIIKPTQNTGSVDDARGWFLVNSGIVFNLSNVTLDGAGYQIHQAIRTHGSGTIDNNIFKNMYYTKYIGFGISVYEGSPVISNNTFTDIERVCVHIYGVNATQTQVINNVFTGAGAVDKVQYAIEVGGGGNALIEQNTISNFKATATSDGSGSAGILVSTYFAPGTAATILNNTITDNTTGVYVGYNAVDTSVVKIESNKLTNNEWQVVSSAPAVEVDASPNWFGTPAGPQPGMLYGNVVGTPWCTDSACTTFADAAQVAIAPVEPVVCGNTTTTTININVVGIPTATPLQGYQFRLHFDSTKTDIANLLTAITNGDFVNDGGFLVANWINETTGEISATPTSIVDVAYAQIYPSTSTGGGILASITLTHKGVPGDIELSLSNVVLSNRDGYVIPSEFSATATNLTLQPAVMNTTQNLGYCTLAEAVAGATTGDNIQLLADITIPTTVTVDKALTLDLNGKTATIPTGTTGLLVNTTAGDLTIKDTATGGTLTGGYSGVDVTNGAKFTLESGSLVGQLYGVYVEKQDSVVNIEGGVIDSVYFAVCGNGLAGLGGTTINITGGQLESDNTVIYLPQAGTVNISGGTLIGHTGIEIKSGELNISGSAVINAWGEYKSNPGSYSNGSLESGDAIFVTTNPDYTGEMKVNITGGTFTSAHGYALREYIDPAENYETDVISISVSGGSFTGGNTAGAAVTFSTQTAGITPRSAAQGLWLVGGLYNTDPADSGATTDPVQYVFVPYGTKLDSTTSMWEIYERTLSVRNFFYNMEHIVDPPRDQWLRGVSANFDANFLFSEAQSVLVELFTGTDDVLQSNSLITPSAHPGNSLSTSFDFFGDYTTTKWTNVRDVEYGQTVAPTFLRITVLFPNGTMTATSLAPTGDRTTILPAVDGLITLQGILAPKAGVPVRLTSGSVVRDTTSLAFSDINYGFTGVETLTYTFTTHQPRYLNITAASSKTFLVNGDKTLNPLRLFGGDVNQDNLIGLLDASDVGTAWGSTANPEANINYDGIVNIQDLALVGGNYLLDSATAYATIWVP